MSAPAPMINMKGQFSGYASVFGQVDQSGDVVMPGAFRKSLARKSKAPIRMLFQHDPKEPIGVWDRIVEDDTGLWVEGRLLVDVGRASELQHLIHNRALDGLSIGFRTVRAHKEPATGYRRIHQIDLWEISIVTFPMMESARIISDAIEPGHRAQLKHSLDAAVSILRQQ